MDAADYVTMDDDIPVADNDMDGYEVRLVTDLRRTDPFISSKHGEIQSSRNDKVEEMPEEKLLCEIKNVMQAMHYIKQLKLFCLEKDYGPMLDSLV